MKPCKNCKSNRIETEFEDRIIAKICCVLCGRSTGFIQAEDEKNVGGVLEKAWDEMN